MQSRHEVPSSRFIKGSFMSVCAGIYAEDYVTAMSELAVSNVKLQATLA